MKMPWTRHLTWLEKQIADERAAHATELARLSTRNEAELDRINLLHGEELGRVLHENKRLQDELERVRLSIGQTSRMAEPVEQPKDIDPDAMPVWSGTPWARVQQREIWLQTSQGKAWANRQLATLKGPESGEGKKEN